MGIQRRIEGRARRTAVVIVVGAVSAFLVAMNGGSPAVSAGGDDFVLGRNNWSAQTTYLNWRSGEFPISNSGLAVLGQQTGGVFATNEEYMFTDPSWYDGIRAFGNDRGGFFYGVDYGAVVSSEYVGLRASSPELGIEASGDIAITAEGRNLGLRTSGPMALEATGAVSFSSAGAVTVPRGRRSAVVSSGTDIIGATVVLATAQTPGGTVGWVGPNATSDRFRIHLVAPATKPVTVAYFVIG